MDAETYLNSLEPIGWKLGLERMELLSDELGRPQDRFESVHVVGTNGKSSVTRMTSALLTAHGRRSGCSVSPHLHRWSERVLIDGEEIGAEAFSSAVETVAAAAGRVNERLEGDERVTQFEVATAASFLALADAGVEVAVIEAGLGGRLDATNSIESKVTILTSIGLDHTEWLGGTEAEIAAEKLAVLRPGTCLVIGELSTAVQDLARRTATGLGARVVMTEFSRVDEVPMATEGDFQRRNFAIALTATEVLVGEVSEEKLERVAAGIIIPARLERVADGPPVFVDVAHNRPGAAALADSVPAVADDRPVIACLGILADKDGPGMLEELAPVLDHLILVDLPDSVLKGRARPGATAFDSAILMESALELGLDCELAADAADALPRARELAVERDGIVLIAGSHYLVDAMGL